MKGASGWGSPKPIALIPAPSRGSASRSRGNEHWAYDPRQRRTLSMLMSIPIDPRPVHFVTDVDREADAQLAPVTQSIAAAFAFLSRHCGLDLGWSALAAEREFHPLCDLPHPTTWGPRAV